MFKRLVGIYILSLMVCFHTIFAFSYRWKKGDNLKLVAKRFSFTGGGTKIKISDRDIAKVNIGKRLKVGEIIEIPIARKKLAVYYIKNGETLIKLSKRSKVPVKIIKKWLNNQPLLVNRKLYLPRIDKKLKKSYWQHYWQQKAKKKSENKEKKHWENAKTSDSLLKNQAIDEWLKNKQWKKVVKGYLFEVILSSNKNKLHFLEPLNLPIAQPYGVKKEILQAGINYKIKNLRTIHAAEAGIVEFSKNLRGMGHTIIIVHSKDFHSMYSGFKKHYKSRGDYVLRGEALGETEDKTVTHALYYRGIPFDPEKYHHLVRKNKS